MVGSCVTLTAILVSLACYHSAAGLHTYTNEYMCRAGACGHIVSEVLLPVRSFKERGPMKGAVNSTIAEALGVQLPTPPLQETTLGSKQKKWYNSRSS